MKNPIKSTLVLLTIGFAIGFLSGQNFQIGAINLDSIMEAQMESVRNSYLKGCVEGSIEKKPDFPDCVQMAKAHEKEIREIINQKVTTSYGKF